MQQIQFFFFVIGDDFVKRFPFLSDVIFLHGSPLSAIALLRYTYKGIDRDRSLLSKFRFHLTADADASEAVSVAAEVNERASSLVRLLSSFRLTE